MAALPDVHAVLGLRREPEVVVALDRVARVAGADSDLDVHHLGGRVPQLLQPAEPEGGLGRQRRVGAGEVAGGEQHQPVGVAAGIGELLVAAAGVEPAAGHVDRPADPVQLAEQVVVAVVAGRGVHVGVLVGQVGGLPVEDRRYDVRAVTLGGEVPHGVQHEPVVEPGGGADREGRRDRRRPRRVDRDPVAPRPGQPAEAKRIDGRVVGVPAAHAAGRAAAEHHALAPGDGKADLCGRPGQHRVSDLGCTGRVSHLVDPDLGDGLPGRHRGGRWRRGGRLPGGRRVAGAGQRQQACHHGDRGGGERSSVPDMAHGGVLSA